MLGTDHAFKQSVLLNFVLNQDNERLQFLYGCRVNIEARKLDQEAVLRDLESEAGCVAEEIKALEDKLKDETETPVSGASGTKKRKAT